MSVEIICTFADLWVPKDWKEVLTDTSKLSDRIIVVADMVQPYFFVSL